jgi:putative Holliday junction resolvase
MPIVSLFDLTKDFRPRQRLLGLDVGAKTIGLALSDFTFTIASPLETIRRTKFTADLETLKKLIAAREVGALVIGLPINMDGSEGPRCQSIRQFAANCAAAIDLPMAFWDERLSTAAVTRTLLEADSTRLRRSQVVDKMAAAYILQGALDRLCNQAKNPV